MPLFDANGRPVTPSYEGTGVRDKGNFVEVDKEIIDRLRTERARMNAITSVPSTPRFLLREANGIAVAKGHGRWPHLTMATLRDVRERSPILAQIHQARQYQIRRIAVRWSGRLGEVGLRVVHKDHLEHNAKPPAGFKPYIERFESVLWRPSPTYPGADTLASVLTALMEDLLTINRPVVELIPALNDPKRIVQWRPVDGALIWPTLWWVEKWLAENPTGGGAWTREAITPQTAADFLSNKLDMDLTSADYCLVRDGIVEAAYPRERLIVAPLYNRTDVRFAGYPPSHVEQALGLITSFMNTFEYNSSQFTRGMMAEFIIGLPAGMHDQDVDAFVDMFREATQGVNRAWMPPIIPLPPGGDKNSIMKIDLKPANREMMFEVWLSLLLSQITAVYRMDPSTINARPWDGGGGARMSENRTEEIALAREEGLQGDFGHLIDHVLNPMAMRCHPDLRVVAEYGIVDPQKQASVYQLRAQVDMSVNEIRLENGRRPFGDWLSDDDIETASPEKKKAHESNPYNWPGAPAMQGVMMQREQMAAQAEQAQQPQPGDDEPPSDGYGGADDGYGGTPQEQPANPYGQPQGGPPPAGAAPMAKARRMTITILDGS